jgi:cytochrome c peroxidase
MVLVLIVVCAGCLTQFAPDVAPLPADVDDYAPLAGYGEMPVPADNPMTPEKVALGWQLYYDARLSGDGVRSCYGCHRNESGLSDGRPTALGAFDKQLSRNAPTMWNIGFHSMFYWDGRAPSLEKQAFAAWKGGNMGADPEAVVAKLNAIPGYAAQFRSVFGGSASPDNVSAALSAYMRTIIGGNTIWDRERAGATGLMNPAAKRGEYIFNHIGCNECHVGLLFTDMVFHNVGVGYDPATGDFADVGRFKVSGAPQDKGAFKTPTLRDVVDSGPYFHDGSAATLAEAVRYMVDGGTANPALDAKLKPASLTNRQFLDLMEFLRALDETAVLPAPRLPPEPSVHVR